MIKYECPKCDSDNWYVKQSGKKTGVYCADCSSFIKWLSQDEIYGIYRKNGRTYDGQDNIALRRYSKKNNITTIHCSECNCLLFNSAEPKPTGQFDLVEAKYCPKCGKKLV